MSSLQVNPSLIYVSVSGFGPTGPYSKKRAYDPVIQAASGLTSIQSDKNNRPQMVRVLVPDVVTALIGSQVWLVEAWFALCRSWCITLNGHSNIHVHSHICADAALHMRQAAASRASRATWTIGRKLRAYVDTVRHSKKFPCWNTQAEPQRTFIEPYGFLSWAIH